MNRRTNRRTNRHSLRIALTRPHATDFSHEVLPMHTRCLQAIRVACGNTRAHSLEPQVRRARSVRRSLVMGSSMGSPMGSPRASRPSTKATRLAPIHQWRATARIDLSTQELAIALDIALAPTRRACGADSALLQATRCAAQAIAPANLLRSHFEGGRARVLRTVAMGAAA